MMSQGKQFAMIGFLFAGSECAMEYHTGSTGIHNAVATGALVGGAMGFRGGPVGAVGGATTFALFSLAIDYFMKG